MSCQYVLLANITLTQPWSSIGNLSVPFSGLLDGQGNTVTLSTFATSDNSCIGFFGYMVGAIVVNLRRVRIGLGDVTVITRATRIGVLSGYTGNSSIFACSVIWTNTIANYTGEELVIGGLVGILERSLASTCFSNLSLTISDVDKVLTGGFTGNSIGSEY